MHRIDYRLKIHEIVRAQEKYFQRLNATQQKYLLSKIDQYTKARNYLMAHAIVVQSLVCISEGGVTDYHFPGIYLVKLPNDAKDYIIRTEIRPKSRKQLLVCDCEVYKEADKLSIDNGVCGHTEAAKLFSLGQSFNFGSEG